MTNRHLKISSEVSKALKNNDAVVALESTIISHGMPYPKNVETALQVERIVRDNGAVPATIAIIDGELKAGLSASEIEQLGKMGSEVIKTSRRDLPFIIAKKETGATTVATTMMIAAMAGIKIFATGGIGGVHRGGEKTMDISADLQELAQTNVAVVCAGAKAILDLGLTLEYLETFGVPVIGYQTMELPAFYSRKSGLALQYSAESPKEIAQILKAQSELDLKGGMVIANPIPEKFEMEFASINEAIEKALEEADAKNISGKAITPFLLSRIEQLTKGKSLAANIQLVYNNAKLAAKIAQSYTLLER
jgi:pseudouridine-5'-phosphate glycosidase